MSSLPCGGGGVGCVGHWATAVKEFKSNERRQIPIADASFEYQLQFQLEFSPTCYPSHGSREGHQKSKAIIAHSTQRAGKRADSSEGCREGDKDSTRRWRRVVLSPLFHAGSWSSIHMGCGRLLSTGRGVYVYDCVCVFVVCASACSLLPFSYPP